MNPAPRLVLATAAQRAHFVIPTEAQPPHLVIPTEAKRSGGTCFSLLRLVSRTSAQLPHSVIPTGAKHPHFVIPTAAKRAQFVIPTEAKRSGGTCFSLLRPLIYALLLLTPLLHAEAPVAGYKIIATYPHSTDSYTEGFFYLDGHFYEGTGMEGRSAILVEDPQTGKVIQRRDIAPQLFGEGIVNWGPNLYEWTWKSHICFVYDRFSLRPIKQFTYQGEGWGMTRTAKEIITSDGSPILRFRNPDTFNVTREIVVKDGKQPIENLNELEYIKGEIYANVWHQDRIARISPKDGRVLSWINLTGLISPDQMVNAESVLNGIAYDEQHDRLFVTGKQWPSVFEIKVIPPTHKP